MRLLIALLAGQFLHLAAASLAEPSPKDRPNIILFLVDDLGWQDVSVPMWSDATEFNRRYQTPNLESLAARGSVFTDAYASSPVCTPTRVAIMTGKSPARTGVTYWTLHKDTDTSRNHPTLAPPVWSINGLQPGDHETLPALLKEAGYETFQVGKAHFGTHGTAGSDPTNLGFDATIAGHASGAPASYYGQHSFSRAGRSGDLDARSPWDVPGLEAYHGRDVYLTEALAEGAVGLIEGSMERSEPFFLWFSPYAVHTPIMANEKLLERYEGLDPREAAYATMIETVDNALGGLMASLERHGQTNNTIIIFWSDNGGLSAHARGGTPHAHNSPARSGKGSAYDGGIRSPGVVSWPGVTDGASGGTRLGGPAIAHDLMPTVLSMAGLDAPAGLDGIDLTPRLRRPEAETEERVIGWHMPHQWGAAGPGIEPFTAIRRGRYKLIYFHSGPRLELYDLERDIGETNDLALVRPGVLAEMAAEMDVYIERTGASLSTVKATGKSVAMPSEIAAAMIGSQERENP